MKEEMQKTHESCPQKDSAEHESYEGAQTLIGMVGDDLVEVQLTSDRMLEYILTPDNLNRAYRQVKSNKGSGGIDKMDVEQLLPYLRSHKGAASTVRIPSAGWRYPRMVARRAISASRPWLTASSSNP